MSGWVKLYRQIDESELMDRPPVVREMFLYFMRNVNPWDYSSHGLKRGFGLFTYSQIQEALSWRNGCVKKTYSKDQIYKALRTLKADDCVSHTKTTRGIVVGVLNYPKFQGFESSVDDAVDDGVDRRQPDTIEKNKEYNPIVPSKRDSKNPKRKSIRLTHLKTPQDLEEGIQRDGFIECWNIYPLKVSKRAAIKAWAKVPREWNRDHNFYRHIYSRLVKVVEYWNRLENPPIPHFSTWLNQARWEDEIHAPKGFLPPKKNRRDSYSESDGLPDLTPGNTIYDQEGGWE